MSELIKCACGSCGAKYRLPAEYAGRSARCKKCGEKFAVPKSQTVEDSVLDWLRDPDEDEASTVDQPRVITMSKGTADDSDAARKLTGPIRIKPTNTAPPAPNAPGATPKPAEATKK